MTKRRRRLLPSADAKNALALAASEGGAVDDQGNYLVSNARISFRESSLSTANLKQESKDRANGRETFLEGVLSHEVGHAKDYAVDRKGTDTRGVEDKNKDYFERRNEIRADDMLCSIRAERFFKGTSEQTGQLIMKFMVFLPLDSNKWPIVERETYLP